MTPILSTALECGWSKEQFDLVSIYGMHKQGLISNKDKKERLEKYREHYKPSYDDEDEDEDEYPISTSNAPTKLEDGTKLDIKGAKPSVSGGNLSGKEVTRPSKQTIPQEVVLLRQNIMKVFNKETILMEKIL